MSADDRDNPRRLSVADLLAYALGGMGPVAVLWSVREDLELLHHLATFDRDTAECAIALRDVEGSLLRAVRRMDVALELLLRSRETAV